MCKVCALLVSHFWILFGKSGTTSSHSSPAIKMHLVPLTRCFNLAQNGEKQLLEKTTDISGWRPWRSVLPETPGSGEMGFVGLFWGWLAM